MKINFIHKNEKYPIEYKHLKKQSIYFSRLNEELNGDEININLVDEFDSHPDLSSEVIHNFIDYFIKQEINITPSTIFSLQYLSFKFQVSKLQNKVDEYIDNNYAELIDNFLQNYEEEQKINCYQEKLISHHISEYLENEIIQDLPINVISRILSKHSTKSDQKFSKTNNNTSSKKSKTKKKKKNNKKLIKLNLKSNKKSEKENDDNDICDQNEEEYKIIDFLIRIIQHHGIEASILLEVIKMSKEGIEYFIEKVNENQVDVDINFLKPILIQYLCNQKVEMKLKEKMNDERFLKMQEECEQKMEDMKNKFDKEYESMKDEYDEKINEIISKAENRNNIYKKRQEEYEQKINEMKEDYNQQFEMMTIKYDEKINEITTKTTNNDSKINMIETEKEKENGELRFEIDDQIKKVKEMIKYNELNNVQKIEQITIKNQQQNELINTNIGLESSLIVILINAILNNRSDYMNSYYIRNLYDILSFLSKENLQSKQPIKIFDSIFIPKKTTNLVEIILQPDNFRNQIGFHSNAVEMLYSNFSFDFFKLMKYCSNYSNVIFEIKRSSSNFESILNQLYIQKNQYSYQNHNFFVNIIFDGQNIQKINYNKKIIDLISLESTINTINENDFSGFSSLLEISIPESVESIGKASFSECTSLTQIKIPSKLKIIDDFTFLGCTKLKEIIIPESVTSIGDYAFKLCSSLSKIDLPLKLTKIGKCSFSNCSSLRFIYIPLSVSTMGEGAFEFCTSLLAIGIPKIFSSSNLGISSKVIKIENKQDYDTFFISYELEKDKIVIMRPLRSRLYDEKNNSIIKRITIYRKSKISGVLDDLLKIMISEGSATISYYIHYQNDYAVEYLSKDISIKNLPNNFNIQIKPHKSCPYRICTLYRSIYFNDSLDINRDCFSFAIQISSNEPTIDDIHNSILKYLFNGKDERYCIDQKIYQPSIFFDYDKKFINITDINKIVQNKQKPIFVIWDSPETYDSVIKIIKNHLIEENLNNQ